MAQFTFFEVNGDPLTDLQLIVGLSGAAIIVDNDGNLEPSTTDTGPQYTINGVEFISSAFPNYQQSGSSVEIYSANIQASGAPITFAYLTATNDGIDDTGNRIVMLSGNVSPGTVLNNINFISGDSDLPYSNIPSFICFTPGALISTPYGDRPVETLAKGDMVITKDNGPQAVRWIGRKKLTRAYLHNFPQLHPIRISQGSLGANTPAQDMWVSPQHRILIRSARAELMFGNHEVLIPAKSLVNGSSILVARNMTATEYVHILFDRHEVIYADGAETESFHPGKMSLNAMDDAPRMELLELFPELTASTVSYGPTARCALTMFEARKLVAQLHLAT